MFGIKPSRLTEAACWYGMTALIVAYGLVSFSIIPGNGWIYLLLNVTGGVGLLVVSAADRVEQSVLLNIFWIGIGLFALAQLIF